MLNGNSKTIPQLGIILPFKLIGECNPGRGLKIKLRPLMHLRAKRLTAKYRASKMFSPESYLTSKDSAAPWLFIFAHSQHQRIYEPDLADQFNPKNPDYAVSNGPDLQ
jgi:hypothetical protein